MYSPKKLWNSIVLPPFTWKRKNRQRNGRKRIEQTSLRHAKKEKRREERNSFLIEFLLTLLVCSSHFASLFFCCIMIESRASSCRSENGIAREWKWRKQNSCVYVCVCVHTWEPFEHGILLMCLFWYILCSCDDSVRFSSVEFNSYRNNKHATEIVYKGIDITLCWFSEDLLEAETTASPYTFSPNKKLP